MRRFSLLALLLAVSGAVAAPAPFAKPERRTDLENLRGEWQVVSEKRCHLMMNRKGGRVCWVHYACSSQTVSVTGDRAQWVAEGAVRRREVIRLGKGVMNPIDLTDELSGKTRQGIYYRTGEVLSIRLAYAGRPKAFVADVDNETVYVLRRVR